MSQFIALVAVLAATGIPAQVTQSEAPAIRYFLQVTPEFCTGGQPRPEHFQMLKTRGVKAVLNLRTPGEHRADEEKAAVEAAGMKYFNVPFVYASPTDQNVEDFLKLTDDPANRPMFVHCTAAIRVGAFWLIRRVIRDGMSWDAALEEARKVGLVNAPHLEAFAKDYLARHPRT